VTVLPRTAEVTTSYTGKQADKPEKWFVASLVPSTYSRESKIGHSGTRLWRICSVVSLDWVHLPCLSGSVGVATRYGLGIDYR
jgi:hypothetical protein